MNTLAGAHAVVARSGLSTASNIGITVYGCRPDEAALFRELAPRYGVRTVLAAEPLSEATVALTQGIRCVSVDHKTPIVRATLLALSRAGVAYLSTRSVGCDHIDVDYARGVGISVGTVAYSPDSVADYTLMLMLMALRHAKSTLRRVGAYDYRLNEVRGRELRDLTVGVIGTGRIGSAVIDRLAGFGCRVLAHDADPTSGLHQVPLEHLLTHSDVVTLHTPLTPDTRHLLDCRRIGLLRTGAIVINTGRGALLDTDALLAALESGRLGGAALDVLEDEDGIFYADHRDAPLSNERLLRLQQLPNVVISPHTAYYTDHALRDTVENTMLNCLGFARENAAWTG